MIPASALTLTALKDSSKTNNTIAGWANNYINVIFLVAYPFKRNLIEQYSAFYVNRNYKPIRSK